MRAVRRRKIATAPAFAGSGQGKLPLVPDLDEADGRPVTGSAAVPLARRVGAWLTWWVLLMSFWVVLDDSIALDELLAGAGAAALGAFLAEFAARQAGARPRMRIEWAARALRLPADIARDTVIVFAALWRRLARGQQPDSGFREVPVRYGDDTAEGQTRRVLLIGGRSIAPNSFALGIDADRDVMIIHQLVVTEGEPAG
jgi:multisubunit Na+/H+ antiporter MnhE subunit